MVEIPGSNVKRAMTQILFDQGYITNFKFEEDDKQGVIKIALKYNQSTKVPAITKLERASRPGLRKYSGASEMPRVLNGLGIAIVSTSRGVITDKEARRENVGGEVLCYVY
jgi:small subunit ribosomal protein S8